MRISRFEGARLQPLWNCSSDVAKLSTSPKLYSNAGKLDNEREDAMRVTLDLPEELAQYLGRDAHSLSRAALEALVLEGVRSGNFRRPKPAVSSDFARAIR
ncbi:MAG TPA: hypothetical protein VII95_10045 [Terriglobales bacterium]|jgi:hypothetical protein